MIKDITIVFVSYHSEKKIIKYLKQFRNKFKVIIVENSQNLQLKKLKKKYKNLTIIVNKNNKGFGSGSNVGLRKVKTRYGMHLDLDTNLSNKSIINLIKEANEIINFAILGPKIRNYRYQKKDFIEKNFKKKLSLMNFIDGCCLLFNMKTLKKIGYFDENYFLYFEEFDLIKRCIKKNYKVLMTEKVLLSHIGRSSSDSKYNNEIEINRNWHYLWSKFYFYNKHYNYFFAFYKIFNQFISALIKSTFYSFTVNENKKRVYKARLSGCWNSIKLNKSWYRPKI